MPFRVISISVINMLNSHETNCVYGNEPIVALNIIIMLNIVKCSYLHLTSNTLAVHSIVTINFPI